MPSKGTPENNAIPRSIYNTHTKVHTKAARIADTIFHFGTTSCACKQHKPTAHARHLGERASKNITRTNRKRRDSGQGVPPPVNYAGGPRAGLPPSLQVPPPTPPSRYPNRRLDSLRGQQRSTNKIPTLYCRVLSTTPHPMPRFRAITENLPETKLYKRPVWCRYKHHG